MSLLPGEITKHSFSAPPAIIRSTMYSLTARGRSTPPSTRLPTGSSSLENARGWIRLPTPAAGMIPHTASPSDVPEQLVRAPLGSVFPQRSLARRMPDASELFRRARDRVGRLFRVARHQDPLL